MGQRIEKTVMEWLGEKKLYDKKIVKKLQEISKTDLYIGKHKLYANEEEMKEKMKEAKSMIDSYEKLISNRNKIQEVIMKFNATEVINISGKVYTIASALQIYHNKDNTFKTILKNNINNCTLLKNKLEKKQEDEVKQLEVLLNNSNKNIGDNSYKEKLSNKQKDYEPLIIEAFNLMDKYTTLEQEDEEFLQNVNTAINIANVKHTLIIELDD